ncbi:MAG TPA: HIT domain-containing protein, partial [Halanaerobiales bacterium]|nr:HIT domain-containing protein [Halanaerobiales bacterium]
KKHIATLLDLEKEDMALVGHIYSVAGQLARDNGIAEDGFRIVSNCNEKGGQSVYHIHFHLLGGRNMQWPPG